MSGRWTWHGGGVEAARRRFGAGDWLDLSTGINPHAWSGVAALTIDWHRLPEEGALADLEAAAAAFFGLDPRHVCAVPGTEIGLRLVGRLIGDGLRSLSPSYRTHGEMADGAPIAIDDLDNHDGSLILANPNNPDGRVLPREQLLALMEHRADNSWLLLDEAFADTHPIHSLADAVDDRRRLIIFRSFGKFFGLAGVRLGFVLGPAATIADLRQMLGAWPVSAAAIAIGAAAYRDNHWIADMRMRLVTEAALLDCALAQAGWAAMGHCPLFRLIEVADGAEGLFERLGRQAILTRPFADRPHWLRIGLPPTDAALARLTAALVHG